MQNLFKFDKLNFITAGMPIRTGKGSYPQAFDVLKKMNLDGMELEFVHGVRMSDDNRIFVKEMAKNFVITAHGPFYINLNSKEEEKIEASVQRIIDTAAVAAQAGAFSITYHAAFYMGGDKETVFEQVKTQTKRIIDILENEKIKVWVRPETTGKATQWGDIDEIINLSKEFEQVLPCVDFSHLHARSAGEYNTYDEFSKVLEKMGNNIGQYALENFHGHLAGIEYTAKGEKQHLNLENSDMNYKDLIKVMKEFGVKGALVCESPNIEDDCKLLKNYYESL
ncbi:endonuclease IV like protein [Clostridium sp. CAG:715]|nr:endonuclease IV like protein [Clostridium sp. CAG:715]